MKIESVQDIRFPVDKHFATGFELWDFESVAGIQPVFQAFRGRSTIRGIHEIVEGLFQCVGLHESVGETKHDVHGGAILVGQFVSVREQQPSRTLEILSLVVRENRLEGTADVVHGLGAEPDHMKAVNDDLSAGQEGLGRIPESPVHIHDHVLHFVPIGEGEQIILDRVHRPGRKDIENAVVQGIRDDALEALTACVSLELVEGDCLRQALGSGYRHHFQHPLHAADGGSGILRNVFHAAAPAQQAHDLLPGSMGEAHVPPDEIIRF